MNKAEAIQKLADHGIHQLHKGESMADALRHIETGEPRKGYQVLKDNGTRMTDNEIIAEENSKAFHRSFTPAVYNEEEVEDIDDIPESADFREDKSERGVILNCYYCGTCMRVDAYRIDGEDYDSPENTDHCEDCMNDAISNLCM